jgi:hypothetical protein
MLFQLSQYYAAAFLSTKSLGTSDSVRGVICRSYENCSSRETSCIFWKTSCMTFLTCFPFHSLTRLVSSRHYHVWYIARASNGIAIDISIQYLDFNRVVTRLTQNVVRQLGVRHGSEKYIVCQMRDIEGIYTGSLVDASCGALFLASSQPK